MRAMKIVLSIIILFVVAILIIYGTLSPCGILKKEIASKVGEDSGLGMYVLFGGFVERGINTLGPIQCLEGLYKVETEGVDTALDYLLK